MSITLLPSIAHADAKKQAKKMLTKAAEQVLKDFKKQTGIHKKLLFSEFGSVDQKLKSGVGGVNDVSTVFSALTTFQVSVGDEVADASTEFQIGMGQALLVLSDASVAVPDRPKGFFYGDGGASDKLAADIRSTIVKLHKSVTQRLRKTSKLFVKHADRTLSFRVSSPTEYLEWNVSPGGGGSTFIPTPLTIDIAIATSSLAAVGDGQIFLGGAGSQSDGTLSLQYSNTSGGGSLATFIAGSDSRWQYVDSSRNEGSYSYRIATQSTVSGAGNIAIGVQ